MRDVHVRLSYVDDLKVGLPISYLEFWFAKQDEIDAQARAAFEGPRPPDVDHDYDVVELRGYWAGGNCEYFVDAWLKTDETIELVSIDFDIDPLRIDT